MSSWYSRLITLQGTNLTRKLKCAHWTPITDALLANNLQVGGATDSEGIPDGWLGLDVGEKSRELFRNAVLEAKTILWNG